MSSVLDGADEDIARGSRDAVVWSQSPTHVEDHVNETLDGAVRGAFDEDAYQ